MRANVLLLNVFQRSYKPFVLSASCEAQQPLIYTHHQCSPILSIGKKRKQRVTAKKRTWFYHLLSLGLHLFLIFQMCFLSFLQSSCENIFSVCHLVCEYHPIKCMPRQHHIANSLQRIVVQMQHRPVCASRGPSWLMSHRNTFQLGWEMTPMAWDMGHLSNTRQSQDSQSPNTRQGEFLSVRHFSANQELYNQPELLWLMLGSFHVDSNTNLDHVESVLMAPLKEFHVFSYDSMLTYDHTNNSLCVMSGRHLQILRYR